MKTGDTFLLIDYYIVGREMTVETLMQSQGMCRKTAQRHLAKVARAAKDFKNISAKVTLKDGGTVDKIILGVGNA